MQATRRLAMPIRVHQIWDAISHSTSAQNTDFEKLMTVVTNMHKVPRDELNHELNNAIKDGLVLNETIETKQREETEVYKLPPKQMKEEEHDWYCFQCHLGGPVVKCEDCPRVFHLECLPEERKPEKDLFICPPCHIKSTKPSAEKVIVKPKALNQLIEYVCDRFKSWKAPYLETANGTVWAEATNRTAKEAWRFDFLVRMPMDLGIMSKKAETGKYVSLEEFQVDCETLVHAIGVYFGLDLLKGSQIGAAFIRDAMHDVQEIKLCHECFRRSNEKSHDWWFCLPCTPPHEVVWAKQTGYPYWPAKVMKKEGKKYDVRYFGGNYERGIIDAKNIQPIETPLTQLKVRKNAQWNEAFDELTKFQDIAKDPDLISALPNRGKGGSGSGSAKKAATKRSASAAIDESTPKRSRKSETPSTTPVTAKSSPKKTANASAGSTAKKDAATPKSNGTAPSQPTSPSKKKAAGNKASGAAAATPARRDSSAARSSSAGSGTGSVKSKKSSSAGKAATSFQDLNDSSSLDPEVANIIAEMEDDSFEGSVYFSDEESSESNDKVSEDAVSSSCTELKPTRSAYVQAARPETIMISAERLGKYITNLKEKHASELSQNKKKQWCFNCEREAIYHCCWNTAYCSIECQQQHWTKEHKRLCRRVRRDRGGTTGQGDDY